MKIRFRFLGLMLGIFVIGTVGILGVTLFMDQRDTHNPLKAPDFDGALFLLALAAIFYDSGAANRLKEKQKMRMAARREKFQARMTRVIATNAAINGQPVRVALDTGAFSTTLTDFGARRLGLEFKGLSHVKVNLARGLLAVSSRPARLTVGAQTFAVPLPVLKFPPYLSNSQRSPLGKKIDGLIGWPEVRDNILVFDATRRIVSSVEELPPETAGWLKLKVQPGKQLLLEAPQPDGATGTIVVDTGAYHGVSLPAAHWKEWRAAHPRAPRSKIFTGKGIKLTLSYMPGVGLYHRQEVWADEIQLGALTLTDLPLRRANYAEIGRRDNFAGSLGMYALARMDLIVDGKNGHAYVRPKPPPGPPYPAIKRPGIPNDPADLTAENVDWKFDGTVRLKDNHLRAFNCVNRGIAKRKQGDLDGAMADFNHALELDPKYAFAYVTRGETKRHLEDFDGALADGNCAQEIEPKGPGAFALRGRTKLERGDYDGANAELDRLRELGLSGVRCCYLRNVIRLQRWLWRKDGSERTIADWNRTIERDPANAVAYRKRGQAWERLDRHEEAIADYTKAIELDPKNSELPLHRGWLKISLGDDDGVWADYRRARELGENIFSTTLFFILFKIRQWRRRKLNQGNKGSMEIGPKDPREIPVPLTGTDIRILSAAGAKTEDIMGEIEKSRARFEPQDLAEAKAACPAFDPTLINYLNGMLVLPREKQPAPDQEGK